MKTLCVCITVLAIWIGSALNAAAAPGPPGNLAATVAGNTVGLSWTAPGGTIIGYRIEAGSAPGLSNLVNTIVAAAPTTLSAPNVPSGTYYVRLRALASDGESAPSNEVVVVVGTGGACAAPPNAPTSLSATTSGMTATLSWVPGGGCPATSYVLQAGSAPGLSNLANVNVGGQTGFSGSAPPGTYHVRVIGQNAFGTSAPSNSVAVTLGGPQSSLQPISGSVSSFGYRVIPVTMPASGLYQATLTWSNPAIDLDLYLTTTACGTGYPPGLLCRRAIADGTSGNTEQIAFPVLAGQNYYLWVDNFTFAPSEYLIQHSISAADGWSTDEPVESAEFVFAPNVSLKRKP